MVTFRGERGKNFNTWILLETMSQPIKFLLLNFFPYFTYILFMERITFYVAVLPLLLNCKFSEVWFIFI